MKHFIIASLFLVSCATPAPLSRLPEPTGTINVPQWQEYCAREGQKDPACK